MTLLETLRRLYSLDARIGIEDGELVVLAAEGECTAALRDALGEWREALLAVAILHGATGEPAPVRDLWDLSGAARLASVLEGRYSLPQAAGRASASTRKRGASARIGSRRGLALLGRAPNRGDQATSPRGRGASLPGARADRVTGNRDGELEPAGPTTSRAQLLDERERSRLTPAPDAGGRGKPAPGATRLRTRSENPT